MESTLRLLYRTDCETILSHLKQLEKTLKVKRRWLMGLHVSKSKQKRLKFSSLPESLLREDDIFFETVTNHVKEAFGENNDTMEDDIIEETKKLFDTSNSDGTLMSCLDVLYLEGILVSCLDVLTNKGLFHFAVLLTRGSANFGKTRPKLMKVVKELIPRVSRDQHFQIEIFSKLFQLLTNPQNVRENCLTLLMPKFHPCHVSAIKILDRLEELSYEALVAMRRNLKGAPAGSTSLQQPKHGESRAKMIRNIRKISKKMLSELGRGDELQAPLAKALAAAGLLLKLSPAMTDFNGLSPEIKMLQNEIVKAIWLLNVKAKVRFPDLKRVQLLVDTHTVIPNASLRTAIKKLLIVYLFECSDMDTIPKSLSQALDIINSSRSTPSGCCLKDEVEEDVECILNVSAHMKQIVSGFLPDHDFDEDYTDAYVEELEESEDDDYDDKYDHHDKNYSGASGDNDGQQHHPRIIRRSQSCSADSDLEESCGDYIPVHSQTNGDCIFNGETTQYEVENAQKFGTSKISGKALSPHRPPNQRSNVAEESTAVDSESPVDVPDEPHARNNLYLGIQEVCDETSMVAYNLIGQMMEKFAQEEGVHLERRDSSYLQGNHPNPEDQEVMSRGEKVAGGSVIVSVVENLLPSLPKSAMEKLKELIL